MFKGKAFLWQQEMSKPKNDKPKDGTSLVTDPPLNEPNPIKKLRRRKQDEYGHDIKIKRKGVKRVNISQYQSKSGTPSDDQTLQIEEMASMIDQTIAQLSNENSPMDEKRIDSLHKLAKRMEKFRKVTGEEGYEDMEIQKPTPNQLMFFQDRYIKLIKPQLKHLGPEESWVIQDYDSNSSEDKSKYNSVNQLPPLVTKPKNNRS